MAAAGVFQARYRYTGSGYELDSVFLTPPSSALGRSLGRARNLTAFAPINSRLTRSLDYVSAFRRVENTITLECAPGIVPKKGGKKREKKCDDDIPNESGFLNWAKPQRNS